MKADWRAIDSPKKQTNDFLFAMTVRKYLKLETLISKKPKNKQIGFGKIYGAPICFRFYLTFRGSGRNHQ
jgi:hypothetical protein